MVSNETIIPKLMYQHMHFSLYLTFEVHYDMQQEGQPVCSPAF